MKRLIIFFSTSLIFLALTGPSQADDQSSTNNNDVTKDELVSALLNEDSADIINEEPEELEVKVKGQRRMGLGATPESFHFKRANYDLNENNFRRISDQQLNNKENTFDPAIYSQLKFDIDVEAKDSPFSFHTNFSIDPWSYTGKSQKVTVTGSGGDRAEVELLYWSNTGYTVNDTVNTLDNGDRFNLPELKVDGDHTNPVTLTSAFSNTFSFGQIDIQKHFQPIREFWMDYIPNDTFQLRIFPMAYENLALTSDDPLHLSNNRIYWEESPWLAGWKPGNFNTGSGDFTRGKWDDDLAFFTRDSDAQRLTALRGFSFNVYPSDKTTIKAVVATPKTLWQEYESVEAIPASMRIKSFLTEDFYAGSTTNLHLAFNDREMDAYNAVAAVDFGFTPTKKLKIEAEVSASFSEQDITNNTYATKERGNAYYLSFTTNSDADEKFVRKTYNQIVPQSKNKNHFKSKLFMARMDDGFDSSLATYRETRDDSFWSRHIHFTKPMNLFFANDQAKFGYHDVKDFAIGNGLDIGRYVIGWQGKMSLKDQGLDGMADFRNVHKTNNKYVETVVRTELEHKTTDRLTTKLFLLYHDLPDTKGGIDPFVTDPDTGEFLLNTVTPDGENPSLHTASLGMQYALTEYLSIDGIWEMTNDFNAANDFFPRNLLNDRTLRTFQQNGQTFREDSPFLYSQGFFDTPPYETHNIIKVGFDVQPKDDLTMRIDYTRNPNEFAGQIDNNINHVGFDMNYIPTSKLGMFFKYTWSRSNDIFHLVNSSEVRLATHHNVFTELRYNINEKENFTLQYGVGPSPTLASSTFDPFGGSLAALDTQHIFRLFYQGAF